MKGRFPFLVVAMQCLEDSYWGADNYDTRTMLKALDEAIADFRGDPDRVFLTGPSSGGAGTYTIGTAHAKRFAGIVPISAVANGQKPEEIAKILAEHKLPIWSFYNQRDSTPGVVEFNEKVRRACLEAGVSPSFSVIERAGHNSWNNYLNPALFGWMLRHSRSSNVQVPHFQWLTRDSFEAFESATRDLWTLDDQGVIRVRKNGEDDLVESPCLHWNPRSAKFGFDFDYRSDRGEPLIVRFTDMDGNVSNDIEFSIVTSHRGNGGLRRRDGSWIISNDPISETSFREKTWNQIRIVRAGDEIVVMVNGWPLINKKNSGLGERVYSVGLVGNSTTQRWRDVRAWPSDTSREPNEEKRGRYEE